MLKRDTKFVHNSNLFKVKFIIKFLKTYINFYNTLYTTTNISKQSSLLTKLQWYVYNTNNVKV